MAALLRNSDSRSARYSIAVRTSISIINSLLYLLLINPAQAQWAFSVGRYNEDVAVDKANNVLLTGQFLGIVDFDPGPDSTKLSSIGTFSDFVAKYHADGSFLWAVSTDSEAGLGVISDLAGNVYVTGIIHNGAFVAKFNADGMLQWRFNIAGMVAQDIAVDGSGAIYLTGAFSGAVDFDPGSGTAELASAGDPDAFVAKYDTDGNYAWGFRLGGSTGIDTGTSLTVDPEGNVYVTGYFIGVSDFDPGTDITELTSSEVAGSQVTDAFLAEYDDSGSLGWAFSIATASGKGPHLAVDTFGNIHMTGTFRINADFDPGAGTTELVASGMESTFLATYNSEGQYEWAIAVESTTSSDFPLVNSFAVDVDDLGNNYVTGLYRGSADFNPGPDTAELTSMEGAQDVFVAKYDAHGNYVWAFPIGSKEADEGRGIAVDSSEGVYVTGIVLGDSADFDPGGETLILTGGGFLAKYNTAGEFPVDVDGPTELPEEYAFSQAYPNPFNESTSFTLNLIDLQAARVEIFDVVGRRIQLLHAGSLSAGTHHFTFNADALPMGIYLITASGETFSVTQKVLLVR